MSVGLALVALQSPFDPGFFHFGTTIELTGALEVEPVPRLLPREGGEPHLLVGIGVWAQLYGMINFELFGQFANTFDDADDLFAAQVDLMAVRMGVVV